MAKYRLDSVGALARQMKFTPQEARGEQVAAAETLLHELDPAKAYPLDFVVYRITGYRPKRVAADLLTGLALQHDLGLLIEQVSQTLDLQREDLAEPVLLIDDLIERFEVTSKTIQRWRRKGLPARSIFCSDGKRRVGFLLSSVERFIAAQRKSGGSVAGYAPLEADRHPAILTHARRLAMSGRCTEREIARRIARRMGQSPLSVLHILRKHDQEQPQEAILPLAEPEPTEAQRGAVLEALGEGVSLGALADQTGRPRGVVYRILLDHRLERLGRRHIRFIDDPLYHQAEAEAVIDAIAAEGALEETPTTEQSRVPKDVPAEWQHLYRVPLLSASRERALFLKFNFHKYQFVLARRRLQEPFVRLADLEALEMPLRKAQQVKQAIVLANQRLVVSIARRHLRPILNLSELVSDGNVTLMRAVEGFDIHKGHRFSTYATLALMKGFARSVSRMLAASRQDVQLDEQGLDRLADPRDLGGIERRIEREDLRHALSRLDERERGVVAAHFGLESGAPATYEQLGHRLGVSKQRVRQIERSALDKLRALFAEPPALSAPGGKT